MKTPRQALGRWGEELAAEYLSERGYLILEQNARTAFGELDLVARQGTAPGVTVFVEVKTRSSNAFGWPEEAVTTRKQAHLLAAAQAYLLAHPEIVGDWRIDVIAIQRAGRNEQPLILYFENAIIGE